MSEGNQNMIKLETIGREINSEPSINTNEAKETDTIMGMNKDIYNSTQTNFTNDEAVKKAEVKTPQENNKKDKVHIQFESYSHNEKFARVVAAVYLSRLDPTVEEVEDVKTAVSEAVTNSIIHAYEDYIGIINMEMMIEDNELTILIQDSGKGISNIEQAMEPLYTSKPAADRSGMGFSFMEAFMDDLKVESKVGIGTTIIMKKVIGIFNR